MAGNGASPLRRFELSQRRAARVTPDCAGSREVRCSAECCERRGCGAIGFSAPARHRLAPEPTGFLTAVPRLLRNGFILPRACRPLQSETPAACPASRPERALRPGRSVGRSASLGVPSLFATSAGGVHLRARRLAATTTDVPGATSPALRSVHGVSHAHDGLLRHRPRGFVSPLSRVQGSPFRGLSLSAEPCRVSPAAAFVPVVQE